jgi:hypothetical protein
MYCLCSNKSFDEILELQEANPVSADEMIAKYTECLGGCGSCINALKAEAEMRELVPQAVASLGEK